MALWHSTKKYILTHLYCVHACVHTCVFVLQRHIFTLIVCVGNYKLADAILDCNSPGCDSGTLVEVGLWGGTCRYLSSCIWGLWSTIKVLAGLISPEPSLLAYSMTTFSLCPHMASSLWAHAPSVSLCVYIFFS